MPELHAIPIVERIQMVEDIWDSIAYDQSALPITSEQKVQLDLRLDAYEADGLLGRKASDVIAELRANL
jgi:putative addiction module component (TIGR02574 family)